jgi:eukaryotic-like serine/threonine-protein kinase
VTTRRIADESCPDAESLASLALHISKGEAPSGDAIVREEHCARCERCRAALDELLGTDAFLARFAADLTAPDSVSTHTSPPSLIRPPSMDGYRIGEEIRHGGQGIVYRALHEASGRDVALKVVRAPSHRRRARIEREATLAARLRHPNIVSIHDCGALADGRYAIALELVDGVPLDEWSRDLARRMAPAAARRERLRVFVRLCDAIEHAHRHGVIHCDIKPDNILVDRDDEPRILDFGVARAASPEEGSAITVTGELACTLAYASPEQLAGNRGTIDTRTDIYSLGVVLYELLTFSLPHAAEQGISGLVASISRSPPPAPSGAARLANEPRIDRDLDTIALTALAKDPDRRYPTAAALKADVLHFLHGEPIAARRDSFAYVLRKAIVRHRRGVAVGAVAVLAALVGITATVIATIQARESRLREESERARLRIEAQRGDAVTEMLRELIPAADGEPNDSEAHRTIDLMSLSLESGTFADDPEAAAAARIAIGDVLIDQGVVRRAEVEYRQAVRLLRGRERPRDAFLATAEERLALLLLRRRSLDEALTFARSAVELRDQTLGAAHPDSLHALCTLANIHAARSDRAQASATLAAIERHPIVRAAGDADPMDAVHETRSRIAAAEGDRDAARRHAEARLRAAFIAHGDGHPSVHAAVDDLLATLTGDDADRPMNPDADPSRLDGLRAIAALLRTRELAEADPSQLRLLLEEKRRVLGERHPDCVETLLQLANRLAALERWEETIEVCLDAERIAMPEGVADTVGEADLLELRADALWFTGRAAEASALGERQLEALRPLLHGTDDVHLAVRIKELSFRHLDNGNFARARELGNEALAIVRATSPNDPHLGWMLSELGQNELRLGTVEDALAMSSEALSILGRADASYSWHRTIASVRRADIYYTLGRFDEARADLDVAARELEHPALSQRERIWGRKHLEASRSRLDAERLGIR